VQSAWGKKNCALKTVQLAVANSFWSAPVAPCSTSLETQSLRRKPSETALVNFGVWEKVEKLQAAIHLFFKLFPAVPWVA
jgi:hypothetical protein